MERFSIIIPARNEAEDIRKALDACLALTYPEKEIIVVDDSTDETPNIVREYASRGVRLIHREKNDGRISGARNVGIMNATGDIVVHLNADEVPPQDFLERISKHYRAGADVVLVKDQTINTDKLIPRYLEANAEKRFQGEKNILNFYSTVGYSCRRDAAIKAGMFPVPPVPITAGDDAFFGKRLMELGYRKVYDTSIVVRHYSAYRMGDFWRINKERVSSSLKYFLEHQPLPVIYFFAIGRTVVVFLHIVLVIPLIMTAYGVARYSPRGLKDVIPFMYIQAVQRVAFAVGKWSSLMKLTKYLANRKGYVHNKG